MNRKKLTLILLNIINIGAFFLPWFYIKMGSVLGRLNFSFFKIVTNIDKFIALIKMQNLDIKALNMGRAVYILFLLPLLSVIAIILYLVGMRFDKKIFWLQNITFFLYIISSIVTVIAVYAYVRQYTNNIKFGYGMYVNLGISLLGLYTLNGLKHKAT